MDNKIKINDYLVMTLPDGFEKDCENSENETDIYISYQTSSIISIMKTKEKSDKDSFEDKLFSYYQLHRQQLKNFESTKIAKKQLSDDVLMGAFSYVLGSDEKALYNIFILILAHDELINISMHCNKEHCNTVAEKFVNSLSSIIVEK